MKEKKEKKPIKTKKNNENKEKFGTKFLNTIKKRWLITRTNTILLIAILIAIVVLINTFVQSLNLTAIDCTTNKEYTLTKESKEKIQDIQNSVTIYLAGYDDSAVQTSFAKQYSKANKNINVEVIDLNERQDIVEKYQLSSSSQAIIVTNGEKSKTIYSDELYTYDSNYQTIDITEEKITSAILNVTSEKIAKIYFLTGYSSFSLDQDGGMYYLSSYLKDEVLEYDTLDMLVTGSIPEDCDTLVITTPSKDFDELTANKIIEYINKGGNILWLNSSYSKAIDLPNVNKVLALYGINPFEEGYIYETDESKSALGYANCIVESTDKTADITKNLTNVMLLNATKINVNKDSLSDLGVTEQTLLTSSNKSYFRKDVSKTSIDTDGDEQGEFTVGGMYTKKITTSSEEGSEDENQIESKLVIIGDNTFVSDYQVNSQVHPMIYLMNNKDLALNSIAYLTNNDKDITIRKDYTKTSSFETTDSQKALIMRIIFIVPIAIIVLGLVIWNVRRRKY